MIGPMRLLACGFALAALVASAAPEVTGALVKPGAIVPDASMPVLGGGTARVFTDARVTLLLFFRPGDRSRDTLRELGAFEKELAGRPVRVVGIVSSTVPGAEVGALVRETRFSAPVLIDEGDALYGALDVLQHPAMVMADQDRRVFAVQPYMKLRFWDIVVARVRRQLGEIDDAQLRAVLDPGSMPMPNDDRAAVAHRHVMLGRKQLEHGNCAAALKSFDDALAIDPANAEALAGRKQCEAK